MFSVGGERLSDIWLMLACVDVEGWSETRLLIAVLAFEVLSEDKLFLYSVH